MQDASEHEVEIPIAGATLPGLLAVPSPSTGVVVFAHGSASSRLSPRNRAVAQVLNAAGMGTLLFDLLTPSEASHRANVFDVELLASRLLAATSCLDGWADCRALPVGYFGASTGAAAALIASGDLGGAIAAVVSRGGRPDLAGERLERVQAPTLLIVGGADPQVLELNRHAQARMKCETGLEVIPGATHLFEEPGALDVVARLAAGWFARHLRRG